MAKVKLKQYRSTSGRPEKQRRTLRALGFTYLNQVIEVEVNPSIQGMINKLGHLVKIEK